MSGSSQYKLLIEAKLDPAKIKQEIAALTEKSVLFIQTRFKGTEDLQKLRTALDEIKSKAKSIEKVSIFGDRDTGQINRAMVQYRDSLGNIVKDYVTINDKVKVNQTYTDNLLATEKQINRIIEQREKLNARQADEMKRASLEADKFLAKAKNMQSTPSVSAAMSKAQEIKVAVSDGDIATVRRLSDEFAVLKSGLQQGRVGLESWAQGLGKAIKQTVQYSLSIGLVYGALNELKKGVQYIKELDKEMTNIQVLRIEGASTNEEIAELAMNYNNLAKQLGSTTKEVASGSVEWLN